MISNRLTRACALILIIAGCLLCLVSAAYGDEQQTPLPQVVVFKLTDTGGKNIDHVSLMKFGENYKDGNSRQVLTTQFDRDRQELVWIPCNDNACTYISLPTAGGTTGRDELVLEVALSDPSIDLTTCYADPTCERLRGGTSTVSGMLDGMFKTGKVYEISIDSVKPGIKQTYDVQEVTA
ncbi:hypothetical protein [Methanospirillum lacunae]|uniref:Uncharacterized protein n=1 Tax=Methanospirillum lacunae TaxID=668570 RepID=A0A2V2NE67_9EURY|nr:hypothetical protein [Methanospirillum lacunae]PWR73891.1 hypothetical protein DK846_01625 [Methanospirillum lacunae]